MKNFVYMLSILLFAALTTFGVSVSEELESAKTAFAEEQYAEALEHLAQIQAFHYREAEQMAEALFYVALIYQKTEAPERSAQVVRELSRFYPESPWSLKAEEEILTNQ